MNARHLLATAFVISVGLASAAAHADTVVADWTFESETTSTAGPYAADIGSGSASGHHAGASTYSSPVGNGSTHSFSSNTWAAGDYYQFQVSSAGLSNLALSYDQISSGTGPADFILQYSTNGTTFQDLSEYTVLANSTPTVWSAGTPITASSFQWDLSSITGVNDQATLFFRLTDENTTSASNGTVGTAGTDRVDNFTVTSVSAVPLPAAIWLLGSGLLGFGAVRPSRKRA